MHIELRRKTDNAAIPAARHDHRTFGFQRQHLFEHAMHLLQLGPGSGQLGHILDAHLALAVVAHARGFQNAGQQIGRHGLELVWRCNDGVRRAGDAGNARAGGEMGFFLNPVLGNRDGSRSGRHQATAGQGLQGGSRHIFKFGGDGLAQPGQLHQALCIAVTKRNVVVADATGRALRVRVEHCREVTQPLGSLHKHTAQLAAAHHAERGGTAGGINGARKHGQAGGGAHTGGSVMARAAAVCSARKACSFSASTGSCNASMATANSAALAAPALPIAKVATGTPLGICTML